MRHSRAGLGSTNRLVALISAAALSSLAVAPVFAAGTGPIQITPSTPLSTIQSDIANDAAVVFASGNYTVGNVPITSAASGEIITFASGNLSGLSFTVNAGGITFESASTSSQANFNGGSGPIFTIGPNGSGTTISNLTFTGIDDSTDAGVITVPGTGASSVTVSNNTFTGLQDTAIGYHGNDNATGTGWTISGNTISDLTGGTSTSGPSGIWLGNLAGSHVTGNAITNTAWAGILLTGGPGTPAGTSNVSSAQSSSENANNIVSGNTISNVLHEGIQIGFGSHITVTGNQVSNAGTSANGGGQNRDGAISLFNPNQSSILIQDNRLLSSYQGITIGQTGFSGAALGTVTVSSNAIEKSSTEGIGNYATSGILNAGENWWGKGVTPSVTSNVTATPYLATMSVALSNDAVTPGTPVTANATVLDNTGATVTGPSISVNYQVYPSGSTSLVASSTLAYGQPYSLPTSLGSGTYTVTASAVIGGVPSANLAGSAQLAISSGPVTTPSTPPPVQAQGTVPSAQGGKVTAQSSNGTTVNVAVPANAFTVPVEVTVNTASTLPSTVTTLANVLQVLTVSATTSTGASEDYPSKPVTLTFQLPTPPSGPVTIQFWNALLNEWQPLTGVSVNGTTITVTTSHFTTFVLVPTSSVNSVERLGGANRMDTSIDAAEAAYPDGASSAILANAGAGVPSPDGLAAAGLAGALHAPILLNPANALDSSVASAITAMGVKTVYVVGGPVAISNAAVTSLQNLGVTVVRDFEGANRFQTAELIDEYMYANQLTTSKTLFIANGATMIDALSASPVAYSQGDPLLLVNTGQTSISASVLAAMQQAGITNVVILGETAAVTPGIQTQLASTFGTGSVIRLGGADRDQTAIAIDQHFFTNPTGVVVAANGAAGGSFVDSLSASALASMNDVPIVLSNPSGLPSSTETYLKSVSLQAGWVMGGPVALTANVATQLGSDIDITAP